MRHEMEKYRQSRVISLKCFYRKIKELVMNVFRMSWKVHWTVIACLKMYGITPGEKDLNM